MPETRAVAALWLSLVPSVPLRLVTYRLRNGVVVLVTLAGVQRADVAASHMLAPQGIDGADVDIRRQCIRLRLFRYASRTRPVCPVKLNPTSSMPWELTIDTSWLIAGCNEISCFHCPATGWVLERRARRCCVPLLTDPSSKYQGTLAQLNRNTQKHTIYNKY